MFQWFKRRSQSGRTAEELYGRVVAASRAPALYRNMGASDTTEGRFEVVALHLFLALESLKDQPAPAQDIARRTIEAFVVDMDDCMREMGVGDMAVPKKVKRAAAGFYERAAAYRAALIEPSNEALETVLQRFVLLERGDAQATRSLAVYVRRRHAELKDVSASGLFAAQGM